MINFRRDKAASSCEPLSRRAKNWAATDDLTARTLPTGMARRGPAKMEHTGNENALPSEHGKCI